MFKLVHTADLGLKNHPYGGINPVTGLNKRFEDIYRTLMYTVNKAINLECKYIIIAGDINEERNPESLLNKKFAIQIRKLIDNNIKIILIAGNHDIDGPIGSSTSISYLKELKLPNVYIADTTMDSFTFEDDDITFHCIPYLLKGYYGIEDNVTMSKRINDNIKKMKFKSKWNVLISHYSTEKTFEGLYVDEVKLNIDVMKRFDYVALGHIHRYEMYNKLGVNGGYSGSIYIKDFGENNDKFINVVEFNKKCTYEKIKLIVRGFLELHIDATECTHEEFYDFIINNLTGKIKDKVIKLKICVEERFNPKQIYGFLREEKAFHFLPIIWEKNRKKKEFKLKNTSKMNNIEIVNRRLESLDISEVFKKDVFSLCKDIINEHLQT